MKVIAIIGKLAGIGIALGGYTDSLPEKYKVIGLLVVGISSALKDVVLTVGDYLDDRQMNKSFKIEDV